MSSRLAVLLAAALASAATASAQAVAPEPLCALAHASAPAPGLAPAHVAAVQEVTLALKGARVLPVEGPELASGTVLVKGGKIVAVGEQVDVPAGARVLDLTGKTVCPGLINAWTDLGLYEIGSIDMTIDRTESGDLTPEVRAIVAVNPHSAHIGVTRAAGITSALTAPTGGLLSGQACVIRLAGWTWKEMELVASAGISCRFPGRPLFQTQGEGESPGAPSADAQRADEARLRPLRTALEQTRRLARIRAAGLDSPFAPTHAALLPLLHRERPLFVEVSRAADIKEAIAFVKQEGLEAVLVGVSEGYKVARELAEAGIPCLVGPLTNSPGRNETIDQLFALPAALERAGVRFALVTGGSVDARNLPFHAGMAAAHGLSRRTALESVTIEPARILKIDARIGSLVPGKDADLIVCDGDPLEATTRVERVFVQGVEQPRDDMHTRLYENFKARPRPASRPK